MPSSFSIDTVIHDDSEIRLWVVIDGQQLFQLGLEGMEGSIFSPDSLSDVCLLGLRQSSSEQIISYGFCDESCCPSTFVTVTVTEQTVTWTGIRESTSNEASNAVGYVFERRQYEAEISRVLVWLGGRYPWFDNWLRHPQTQLPETQTRFT